MAKAAQMLRVTEDRIAAALGDPTPAPPDFEAAARELGVAVGGLIEALGPPPGTGGG